MRVAVTGAGGFVGRAIVVALRAAGHDTVAVTTRLPGPFELDGVEAVVHLAAQVRVRDPDVLGTWRTNLGGTLSVLDAMVRAGATRLALASTAAPPETSAYAASKRAAELAAADVAAGGALGVVSLRLANVAGPGDTEPTRLVPALLSGREFVVNGDGSAARDLVHVEDVADAVVAALDHAHGYREIPIGSGHATSVRTLLDVVARVTGRRVPVRHREATAEPAAVVADPAAARALLGWTPRRSTPERIVADAWAAMR